MERRFFDWGVPFLRATAKTLIDENSRGGKLDLSEIVLVFPSSRLIRQFESFLIKEVEKRIEEKDLSPDWFPPEIITIGLLPELLYKPQRKFANSSAVTLAWLTALLNVKAKNPAGLAALFPTLSEQGNFSELLEFANLLSRLHSDLASEGADFATPTKAINLPQEVERWQILCEIEREYLATLERNLLCDKETERKTAITQKQLHTDKRIILIGTADLNNLQKEILDQISDSVTIFICAPESEESYFDSHGSVLPDLWKTRTIPIPDSTLFQTADPVKEGEAAALAALQLGQPSPGQEFTPSLVTISVPDSETIPFLTATLADLGIPAQFGGGKPVSENRVFLLLRAAADYLRTNSFTDFAALIRHPDFENGILRILPDLQKADILSLLDKYQTEYIPQRILLKRNKSTLIPFTKEENTNSAHLARLLAAASELLAPLRGTENSSDVSMTEENESAISIDLILQKAELTDSLSGTRRSITDYPSLIADFLERFYGNTKNTLSSEAERQIDEGLKIFYRIFDEILQIPSNIAPSLFTDQALIFVLRQGNKSRIPPSQTERSLELIGWLDTLFDPAPNLVVAGLNDGIVPQNQLGDVFLPNTVREKLLLEDNQKRYARDAYALTVLAASRNTQIFFARKSLNETPLLPSRLLFTGPPIEIANRVCRFFSGKVSATPIPKSIQTETLSDEHDGHTASHSRQSFNPPILRMTTPLPEVMNVTDFETFLHSPYRYFLTVPLRIEQLEDKSMELNAASFGNIIHDVLHEFGADESIRDTADEKKISSFLSASLDRRAQSILPHFPAGTVIIQLEQIRRRLMKFAQWQAAWRSRGPRIAFVEAYPQEPVLLTGNFETHIVLHGRIDRIDYDEKQDQWFVFDYKTFDTLSDSTSSFPDTTGWQAQLVYLTMTGESESKLLSLYSNNTTNLRHRKKVKEGAILFEGNETYSSESPKQWINLQLPLYAKIAEQIIAENIQHRGSNPIALGYIILPKTDSVLACMGNWSREDLEQGYQTACWVRRMIERLWQTEINPSDPVDPDQPELGKILNSDELSTIYELRDFTL